MTQELQTLLKLEIALLLQLAGLGFAAMVDPYLRKDQRRHLLAVTLMAFSMVVQNRLQYVFETDPGMILPRVVCSVYGYCVPPVILLLFLHLVNPGLQQRYQRPLWGLILVNTAVYLTTFFSDIAFRITPENDFIRGPLGYTGFVVSAVLLGQLVFASYRIFRQTRKQSRGFETVLPIANAVLVLAGAMLDFSLPTNGYVSFLIVAMVSACVFYYLWLHLQFAREHENAMAAEQRIQIMISQIQPHFLFNTLSTIQALCRIDPEKAFDTTEKFGTYLRQNLDSLGQPSLIPLEQELEHTRIYAEIEQIRFPYIRVEYEIEDLDFEVPALTVQPLVENAIRHGIRIRPHGLVTVSSRRETGEHVIMIRDNGKGFDTSRIDEQDSSHIGIRNVRERIEMLCDGTMTIDSTIGEGTAATIRIPAGEETE